MSITNKELFGLWLKVKKPYFRPITGLILFILTLSLILSIASFWLFPTIWLKLLISTIVLLFIFKFIFNAFVIKYFDEFMSGNNKL